MNVLGPTQMMVAHDTSYLDKKWLDENNRIRLLPTAEYLSVPNDHLRLWMHRHARYVIPTVEAIDWLLKKIAGRKAIEIGAGNADFYYHLGITGTDSCVQRDDPKVAEFYRLTGQPPTMPPSDVLKLEAEKAVKQLQPEVVIGTYVTRKFVNGVDVPGRAQASEHGTRDEYIIRNTGCYIHLGNSMTHGQKTALRFTHEKLQPSWLVTRAQYPEQNVVYIWGT